MKRILVLSDSHSGLSFMRWCINNVKPDAIIHLGDYYEDGQTIAEEYHWIPMIQVPGNCDKYRTPLHVPEILIDRVCGVDLYMTHGHKHRVKSLLGLLIKDAKASKVQAVLYGHTHIADCHREGQLWVLNPGASGSWGGSAGLIEVENDRIVNCRVFGYGDPEVVK